MEITEMMRLCVTRESAQWFPSIHQIVDEIERVRCYGSIPVFQTGRAGSTPATRTCKCEDAGMDHACGVCTKPVWLEEDWHRPSGW